MKQDTRQSGLYRPEFEHDNCGIGAIVNSKGQKSHRTVENALRIVENLEHRAGKDAEGKTEMALVSCFRFLTSFSQKHAAVLALIWDRKKAMVLLCCFSHRMN